MRLFLFYFSRTLLNTIKKLMKTWVAIILIMMVFGAVIGFASSFLFRDGKDSDTEETTVTDVVTEDGEADGT